MIIDGVFLPSDARSKFTGIDSYDKGRIFVLTEQLRETGVGGHVRFYLSHDPHSRRGYLTVTDKMKDLLVSATIVEVEGRGQFGPEMAALKAAPRIEAFAKLVRSGTVPLEDWNPEA